ncbi:Outer membrane protein romA [Candidatus Similichlamydia laticola]|uniref:Outer membrane protein romA n=1 Tax=Candidatus Similichlamydia laticola TaxID=2170265 RepID=A0A369KF47_9BACT|nr:Outer membrane protein romA [Candidatus Similichlamydia laticola]
MCDAFPGSEERISSQAWFTKKRLSKFLFSLRSYFPSWKLWIRRFKSEGIANIYSPPDDTFSTFRKVCDLSIWVFHTSKLCFAERFMGRKSLEKRLFRRLRARCRSFSVHLDQPFVSWIGHSTFFLKVCGITLLTDPIWSYRAGFPSWPGLSRSCLPPVSLDVLGGADLVLISHNHPDHLDMQTIAHLSKLRPNSCLVVPKGVGECVASFGLDCIELAWGEECRIPFTEQGAVVNVTSVPAIHNSGRGLLDRNMSMWCGWICRFQRRSEKKKTLYYVGDTAFSEGLFQSIGRRFGSIDLSLVPVGAYLPRSLLGQNHISPREAVAIHKLVLSKKSIGCHHSTFRLSDVVAEERALLEDLESGLRDYQVSPCEFFLCPVGHWFNW